jgi:hypothetical protein
MGFLGLIAVAVRASACVRLMAKGPGKLAFLVLVEIRCWGPSGYDAYTHHRQTTVSKRDLIAMLPALAADAIVANTLSVEGG